MDPAGWQRAKVIIEEALQRPPSERAAYVTTACDDGPLRDEIIAALESYAIEDEVAARSAGPRWQRAAREQFAAQALLQKGLVGGTAPLQHRFNA